MERRCPWFALQTRPRSEKKVARSLTNKEYECFLPTYRQKRQWSDRIVEVELPLFPNYIFCRFGPAALGKAVATPGIVRIVGFGGTHAEVDDGEIDALQQLARSPLSREPWTYIPDGSLVRVETGPLAGVEGIYLAAKDKKRIVISITLLQRSVAVQLDENAVLSIVEGPKEMGIYRGGGLIPALKLTKRI